MKQIYFLSFLIVIFSSSLSGAECNLQVATAAGQYLAALEKAKLTRYQNNSVCEVLSYEFWCCTDKQKSKLNLAFDPKEILGNYCGPHLLPQKSNQYEEPFMKGVDLYSWQDRGGYIWFALLIGTNKTKTTKELIENKIDVGYFMHTLKRVPSKTQITWNNLVVIEDKSNLEFSLPDKKTVNDIMKTAESKNLVITIIK